MKILNKKEIKKIIDELKDYYAIKDLELDYTFLKDNKDKIYIISNDFKLLNSKDLRISSLGLYFIDTIKGLRLSIEGSQIIGKQAKKNIYEASDDEIKEWLKGYDLECSKKLNGYQLIKNKNDFYGIGFAFNEKIRNFIPRERRIKGNV